MSRGRTVDLLTEARRGRYAVAAVNVVDDLSIGAVVDAAQQTRAPVIVQTSVKTVRAVGAPLLHSMVTAAADAASVPVALHLDHCPDRAVISTCLASGWSSVLFDASDRSLAQATEETSEVVAEAHAVQASVEAEIENITGVEDGVGSDLEGDRYPVDVIAEFVASTGCDFFAPAVGTAHGLYSSRPRLDPWRAAELSERLDVPLVLHGGTGLTEQEFRAFIDAGCSKVNLSTTLKRTYMQAALQHLREAEEEDRWDPPALFAQVARAVTADTAEHIRTFGAAGRA